MRINTLIFEGGGIKGLCYVGALKEMEENNMIDLKRHIKYVGGTSAGSIVAALIASNHSTSEMRDILFNTKWEKFKDGFFTFNVIRLIKKFGFYKGEYLEKFVESALYKKLNIKNITFKELFQMTNKHLKIIGTNLSSSQIIYMDHILTPDMPVAKGVQISSCIPVVFKPVKYKNNLFIDGGLLKNLDTRLFSSEPNSNGIAFDLMDDVIQPDKKLSEYLLSIIQMLVAHVNKKEEIPNIACINIDVSFVKPLKFKLEECEKKLLIIQGAQAVQNYILEKYVYN
tara:strand:+ start:429 stop:1280 length:852 start_codon:yes stop_codon:yes gene_type:complete